MLPYLFFLLHPLIRSISAKAQGDEVEPEEGTYVPEPPLRKASCQAEASSLDESLHESK